jgi:hypothetical protein
MVRERVMKRKTQFQTAVAMVIALLLPTMSMADVYQAGATQIRFNADSTTVTYCSMLGQGGSVFGGAIVAPFRLDTSGSNTTVTSETALQGALAPVAVNDVIFVRLTASPSVPDTGPFAGGYGAVVTAKASDDSITVDPAVNWSVGLPYTYYKATCGTTDAFGWVSVAGARSVTLKIAYEQGDLDNLSWRFECRPSIVGGYEVIYPNETSDCGSSGTLASGFCDFATPGANASFSYTDFGNWSQCRIGFKVKTTDASDAGANRERVTSSIGVGKVQ